MSKFIVGCILTALIVLFSGIFPTVAVGLTAIIIVSMFLIFGKES